MVTRECIYCSEIFTSRSPKAKLCSRGCFNLWKVGRDSKNRVLYQAPEVTPEGKVEAPCKHCGKLFRCYPYERRKGRVYCSLSCSGERRITRRRTEGDLLGTWRAKVGFGHFARAYLDENSRCGVCGTEDRRALVLHHIEDPGSDLRLLFAWENLKPICRACHATEHDPLKFRS